MAVRRGKSNRQCISKLDLALRQLRRAIQLHRQGDYVCSITLAGGAEELLGRIAEREKNEKALDKLVLMEEAAAHHSGRDRINSKKLFGIQNSVLCGLKHFDQNSEDFVEANFTIESQEFTDRAITNYRIAYNKNPADRAIKKYISEFFPW